MGRLTGTSKGLWRDVCEVVDLLLDVDEKGDVDGEGDERDEGCEKGEERGDQGHGDVC